VLIRNGRIAAIEPAAELPASDSALRIDGRGKYLMPGLADMHVHLFNSKDLVLYLANGVTTIRNLGGYGAADSILEIRRQVRAGERLGPTIYTSGNWLDGDPPYRSINTVVRTPAEARAEVERQARAGYDFIKVYATLAPDVYREITSTARANGIPVTGHVPGRVGLARVLESGQVAVDHLEETPW
jgi:imidazolonepropionase-like amidohydrolase